MIDAKEFLKDFVRTADTDQLKIIQQTQRALLAVAEIAMSELGAQGAMLLSLGFQSLLEAGASIDDIVGMIRVWHEQQSEIAAQIASSADARRR